MSREVHNHTEKEASFAPVLDGDKLNVRKTADLTAKLLLDDALLGPSGSKGKKIYQQKLLVSVQDIDSQLEKYTRQDSVLSQKFEDKLKANLEKEMHENKLLYMFLKAETPQSHRFHNKMSYRQLEDKIFSSGDGHHLVEHSLLTLIETERNRSFELQKVLSKLNPFTWLDKKCESLMYSWFILECVK